MIGIVILNYKTYLDTERLVGDILSRRIKHDIRIVIVDNASPNESFEYLNNALKNLDQIEIIQSSCNAGFAKGNNVGLRLLKNYSPSFALVLNNDVHFDVEILDHLVEMYSKLNSPGIISPLQKLPENKSLEAYKWTCNTFWDDFLSTCGIMRFFYNKSFIPEVNAGENRVQCVDFIPGCFIFIDYNLFESIGFFDESTFLFCEERLLFKQMQKKNRQNYFILDCFYVHEHSKTINNEVSLLKQKRLLLEGYIIFTQKYRRFPQLKVFLLKFAFIIYSIKTRLKFVFGSLFNL